MRIKTIKFIAHFLILFSFLPIHSMDLVRKDLVRTSDGEYYPPFNELQEESDNEFSFSLDYSQEKSEDNDCFSSGEEKIENTGNRKRKSSTDTTGQHPSKKRKLCKTNPIQISNAQLYRKRQKSLHDNLAQTIEQVIGIKPKTNKEIITKAIELIQQLQYTNAFLQLESEANKDVAALYYRQLCEKEKIKPSFLNYICRNCGKITSTRQLGAYDIDQYLKKP